MLKMCVVYSNRFGGYVMKGVVSTLHLNGKDAYYFVSSLFEPSPEMLEKIVSSAESLNSITINKVENGFEAEIDDLDLSFLNRYSNINCEILDEVHINTEIPLQSSECKDGESIKFTLNNKVKKNLYYTGISTVAA
jgi:hypothetical protein